MKQKYLIYYGQEIPSLAITQSLRNYLVVLQEYHFIAREGIYQNFFPNCSRFLYWNPAFSERYPLPETRRNEYGLYPIDIDNPKAFDEVYQKAMNLLSYEGVQGLFVDDLDLLCQTPKQRSWAIRVINQIYNDSRGCRFFLNRGFSLWHRIQGIEAILLEGITPETVNEFTPSDAQWLDFVFKTHIQLALARPSKPSFFGLDYRNHAYKEENRHSYSRLANQFLELLDQSVTSETSLNSWNAFLPKNKIFDSNVMDVRLVHD